MITCDECYSAGCEVCNNKGWIMGELRLHLAETNNKIVVTEPDIALALQHKDEINSDPRKWASLEISQFPFYRKTLLHIGNIHTDGMKERATVTRTYNVVDGRVTIGVRVHL